MNRIIILLTISIFLLFSQNVYGNTDSNYYSHIIFNENISNYYEQEKDINLHYIQNAENLEELGTLTSDTFIVCENEDKEKLSPLCNGIIEKYNLQQINIGNDVTVFYNNDPLLLLMPSVYFHDPNSFEAIQVLLSEIFKSNNIKNDTFDYLTENEKLIRSPDNILLPMSKQFISYLFIPLFIVLLFLLFLTIFRKQKNLHGKINILFLIYIILCLLVLALTIYTILKKSSVEVIPTLSIKDISNNELLFVLVLSIASILIYSIYLLLIRKIEYKKINHTYVKCILFLSVIFLIIKFIFPQFNLLGLQLTLYLLLTFEILTYYIYKLQINLKLLSTIILVQFLLFVMLFVYTPAYQIETPGYEVYPGYRKQDIQYTINNPPSNLSIWAYPIYIEEYDNLKFEPGTINDGTFDNDILFITRDMYLLLEMILLYKDSIYSQDVFKNNTNNATINYYDFLEKDNFTLQYDCDNKNEKVIDLDIHIAKVDKYIYDDSHELDKHTIQIVNAPCATNSILIDKGNLPGSSFKLNNIAIMVIAKTDGKNFPIKDFDLSINERAIPTQKFKYLNYPTGYYQLPISNNSNTLLIRSNKIRNSFEIMAEGLNIEDRIYLILRNIDTDSNDYYIINTGESLYLHHNQ